MVPPHEPARLPRRIAGAGSAGSRPPGMPAVTPCAGGRAEMVAENLRMRAGLKAAVAKRAAMRAKRGLPPSPDPGLAPFGDLGPPEYERRKLLAQAAVHTPVPRPCLPPPPPPPRTASLCPKPFVRLEKHYPAAKPSLVVQPLACTPALSARGGTRPDVGAALHVPAMSSAGATAVVSVGALGPGIGAPLAAPSPLRDLYVVLCNQVEEMTRVCEMLRAETRSAASRARSRSPPRRRRAGRGRRRRRGRRTRSESTSSSSTPEACTATPIGELGLADPPSAAAMGWDMGAGAWRPFDCSAGEPVCVAPGSAPSMAAAAGSAAQALAALEDAAAIVEHAVREDRTPPCSETGGAPPPSSRRRVREKRRDMGA